MKKADVIIIGSGPVGMAAACRLAERGLDVSILDGGRAVRDLPFAGRLQPDNEFYYYAPWDMLHRMPAEDRKRVTLRQGLQVRQLLHHNGQIAGLDVVGPAGDQEKINGPLVILAGGALATPKLLYQSEIRPAALGRGLSFHALLFGQVLLNEGLCPQANERDMPPRLYIPPTEKKPWHIQVLRDTCPLPPKEAVQNPHRLLEFQAFLAVEHQADNRMHFGNDGQAQLRFTFSKSDRRLMAEMAADVQQLGGLIGRWRRGCEPFWVPHGTAHLMGTCRMDHGESPGVTVRDGRVHGIENLYLATAGLFPRPVAVNPTLTATALALHTCDRITV